MSLDALATLCWVALWALLPSRLGPELWLGQDLGLWVGLAFGTGTAAAVLSIANDNEEEPSRGDRA